MEPKKPIVQTAMSPSLGVDEVRRLLGVEILSVLEEILPAPEVRDAFLRDNPDIHQAKQLEVVRRALSYSVSARLDAEVDQAVAANAATRAGKGGGVVKAPRKPAATRQQKLAKKGLDDGQLLHTARTLALCSMPYERTDASEITRNVTIDGTTIYVRFSAYDKSVPLPYGKDRALLTWVMSKALEQGHPRVSWDSAASILYSFQVTKGGRQIAELRDSISRICNVVIGWGVMHDTVPEPGRDRGSKIIYEWSMPSKHDVEAEGRGERRLEHSPYYLEIEPKTYSQLHDHPVSLPMNVLQRHIGSPLTWDFLNFLGYQATCTPEGEKKAISLSHILTFLGSSDTNLPRLKSKLQGVINDLNGFLGDIRLEGRGSSSFLFLEGRGKAVNMLPRLPFEEQRETQPPSLPMFDSPATPPVGQEQPLGELLIPEYMPAPKVPDSSRPRFIKERNRRKPRP